MLIICLIFAVLVSFLPRLFSSLSLEVNAYLRTIREAKKYRKIITETRRYRNELDNPNLKLLSSIKIICEYVTNASHKKIEYFLNKHLPPAKVKKITVEEMTPEQQISDILSTFKACFPKKKEKEMECR